VIGISRALPTYSKFKIVTAVFTDVNYRALPDTLESRAPHQIPFLDPFSYAIYAYVCQVTPCEI